MTKEEIYNKYARIPEEDGTFSDYKKLYMDHKQQNKDVLIRACKEFTKYVYFCMDICTRYKSKVSGKYKQFPREELDFNDYEINLFYSNEVIYPDTDLSTISYPNIKGLVAMNELQEGYRGVFNRLLEGETFLELEN